MNVDLQIEGRYSQRTEDLQHLKQCSTGTEAPSEAPSEYAVSVFKALALILGAVFSLATIILMKPAIAFIYVTLILGASGTIAMGSEKIITILPARIWTSKHLTK
ncbi:MAG: hypothetical protein JSS30_07315 [Verrucomicrobia bacterium]|nr:hypothetical protein [Verrucomicrobiota bacterium]